MSTPPLTTNNVLSKAPTPALRPIQTTVQQLPVAIVPGARATAVWSWQFALFTA